MSEISEKFNLLAVIKPTYTFRSRVLTHFSPVMHIVENQLFDLHCESSEGFLFDKCETGLKWVNPFLANITILYPLKIPEKLWFSGVFMRYKIGTLVVTGIL